MAHLLHHLLLRSAERDAGSTALTFLDQTLSYGELAALVDSVTTGLLEIGIGRGDRVAFCFFFSSRRRHTRFDCDWSSDVCSSDLFRAPSSAIASSPVRKSSSSWNSWPTSPSASRSFGETRNGSACVPSRSASPSQSRRSEERRVGKEGRSRWSPDH